MKWYIKPYKADSKNINIYKFKSAFWGLQNGVMF